MPPRPRPHPFRRPLAWAVAALAAILVAGAVGGAFGHGTSGVANRIAPTHADAPSGLSCPLVTGPEVRYAGVTQDRVVALTFDDGPGPETSRILDMLHKAGAQATFFVIGRQIAGNEAVLKRAVADGDVLGNHTWDHVDVSRGGSLARRQLQRTSAALSAVTGLPVCLMRPPFGRVGPHLLAEARREAMLICEWDVDPADWKARSPRLIARGVLASIRPGAIVVMHDGGPNARRTLAALPRILTGLRNRGYRSVTVPAILG